MSAETFTGWLKVIGIAILVISLWRAPEATTSFVGDNGVRIGEGVGNGIGSMLDIEDNSSSSVQRSDTAPTAEAEPALILYTCNPVDYECPDDGMSQ